MIDLRILMLPLRSDEVMRAGVVLGDVLEDPAICKSYRAEDCAFQRAHSVSVFNYYDGVRTSLAMEDSSADARKWCSLHEHMPSRYS